MARLLMILAALLALSGCQKKTPNPAAETSPTPTAAPEAPAKAPAPAAAKGAEAKTTPAVNKATPPVKNQVQRFFAMSSLLGCLDAYHTKHAKAFPETLEQLKASGLCKADLVPFLAEMNYVKPKGDAFKYGEIVAYYRDPERDGRHIICTRDTTAGYVTKAELNATLTKQGAQPLP